MTEPNKRLGCFWWGMVLVEVVLGITAFTKEHHYNPLMGLFHFTLVGLFLWAWARSKNAT